MATPATAGPAGGPATGAFRLEDTAPGRLAALGPLTFATARHAREQGLARIAASCVALAVDCAGITASDSAGLAVLIDWLAAARGAGRALRYVNLPAGLTALARISEVRDLLEHGV